MSLVPVLPPSLIHSFTLHGFMERFAMRKLMGNLLPDLFAHLNPMTQQRALAIEVSLAEDLRHEGFAVWQN